MYYDQTAYNIRCEWGAPGIAHLATACDVVIIVDVLSFSTCVDVAVGRGAVVYPFLWGGEALDKFAAKVGGVAASSRRADEGRYTLSPASLRAIPAGTRLVLPSPNGATLSLATGGTPTLAGCLRNARSVGRAALSLGQDVLVVPAGERWGDGTLRPAIEDLIGAGAIISHMDGGMLSPEAQIALSAYEMVKDRLYATLAESSSGRELIGLGFGKDVELASMLNCSDCAPILRDGAYRAY
jgi:2-phosphosulfolactate phosphatase